MASKRNWAPGSFPVREPTNTQQEIGRVVNPVRTQKIGGKGEARLLDTEKQQKGTGGPNAIGPVSDRGKGARR